MTRYLSILILASLLSGCAGSPDIVVEKNVSIYVFGDSNEIELLYEQLSETTVEAQIDQTTKGTLKGGLLP